MVSLVGDLPVIDEIDVAIRDFGIAITSNPQAGDGFYEAALLVAETIIFQNLVERGWLTIAAAEEVKNWLAANPLQLQDSSSLP
jgi:hypothetical protein